MKRLIVAACAAVCGVGALAAPASAASSTTQCSGTLSGTYDRVVVPDGATCILDGATVTGNVTVGAGSILRTKDATIGGNLMSRGATALAIIDTNVDGNLKVSDTAKRVKIGGKGCQIDPSVANNLMLKGNLGNIAICDLTINNNLTLMDNAGRIGVFRNTVGNNLLLVNNTGFANRVRNNDIGSNLNCHGNTQKVISKLNTAHQFLGQCTA